MWLVPKSNLAFLKLIRMIIKYTIEFHINNLFSTPVRKFTLGFRSLEAVIEWADKQKKDNEYYHIIE